MVQTSDPFATTSTEDAAAYSCFSLRRLSVNADALAVVRCVCARAPRDSSCASPMSPKLKGALDASSRRCPCRHRHHSKTMRRHPCRRHLHHRFSSVPSFLFSPEATLGRLYTGVKLEASAIDKQHEEHDIILTLQTFPHILHRLKLKLFTRFILLLLWCNRWRIVGTYSHRFSPPRV